jgi:hypothetical protein
VTIEESLSQSGRVVAMPAILLAGAPPHQEFCLPDKRGNRPRSESGGAMRSLNNPESGKIGWLLLWLVGIPVPILLILFLLRGCT